MGEEEPGKELWNVWIKASMGLFDIPQHLMGGSGGHISGGDTVGLVWVISSHSETRGVSGLPGVVCMVFFLHTCPASHCQEEIPQSGDPDFSLIILHEALPRALHTVGLRTLVRGVE